MNQDLIRYVECVKDQETIVYKYEEIINILAIPEKIDKPIIRETSKKTKVKITTYLTAAFWIFFGVIIALMLLFEQKINEINAQNQPGSLPAVIFMVGIIIMSVLLSLPIPLLSYANKKRKVNKAYSEQKHSNEALNKSEMEFYQRCLEEEQSRLKKENAVKDDLEKRLTESRKVLNQLYDVGIIFPKYRNFASINMICEYLQSGRCDKLTGPDGAYNLYESELRANIIIEKLDDIIDALEDIKKNQYLIYSAIKETNALLSEISDELEEIGESAHIAALNSQAIARETETIKYLTYMDVIKEY